MTLLALSRRTRALPKWGRYAGASLLVADRFRRPDFAETRKSRRISSFCIFRRSSLPRRCSAAIRPSGRSRSARDSTGFFLFEPRGFAISDPARGAGLGALRRDGAAAGLRHRRALPRLRPRSAAEAATDARGPRRARGESSRLQGLLLQEMAHRTKNDLQFLASMLQIEGRALEAGMGRASLLSAASRIAVVGRVHSLLQRGGPAHADMQPLIDELCADLRVSLVGVRPVALRAEVEPCVLPLETARSTALIVNELVTNALKHAFPDERPGNVKIRLAREQDEAVLIVEDDGVGLPSDVAVASRLRPEARALARPAARRRADDPHRADRNPLRAALSRAARVRRRARSHPARCSIAKTPRAAIPALRLRFDLSLSPNRTGESRHVCYYRGE